MKDPISHLDLHLTNKLDWNEYTMIGSN